MRPYLKIDTKDLSFVKSLMEIIDTFISDERIDRKIRQGYVEGIKIAVGEKEKLDNPNNTI